MITHSTIWICKTEWCQLSLETLPFQGLLPPTYKCDVQFLMLYMSQAPGNHPKSLWCHWLSKFLSLSLIELLHIHLCLSCTQQGSMCFTLLKLTWAFIKLSMKLTRDHAFLFSQIYAGGMLSVTNTLESDFIRMKCFHPKSVANTCVQLLPLLDPL